MNTGTVLQFAQTGATVALIRRRSLGMGQEQAIAIDGLNWAPGAGRGLASDQVPPLSARAAHFSSGGRRLSEIRLDECGVRWN